MAKKGATCTEIKKKKLPIRVYEIGHFVNDKIERDVFEATNVSLEGDDLTIWMEDGDGEEVQVGAFRNWQYYKIAASKM
jgi:hypothetical protein